MTCAFTTPGDDVLFTYASRVGADSTPQAWILTETIKALQTRRLCCYGEVDPRPNGHAAGCGGQQGTSGRNIVQIGAAGAGAGVSLFSTVVSTGIGAGTGAAAALSAVAGPLAIAVLPLAILGGILQHHAQAVARENSTLTSVTCAYNAFADAMEDALCAGKIGLQDALGQLKQAANALRQQLAQIEKPVNAGYGWHKILDALELYNKEVVYPALVPGFIGGLTGKAGSLGGLLAIGGGALLARGL